MVLLLTYDLHKQGRDYSALERLITSATSYTHPLGSVWFVDTYQTMEAWRDSLANAGDSNDEFLVTRLHKDEWRSSNLDRATVAWLDSPSRNW